MIKFAETNNQTKVTQYARHYLKGKPRLYSNGHHYWRITWSFDENNALCALLEKAPDAVTMIYSKKSTVGTGIEGNGNGNNGQTPVQSFTFKFAEFYGDVHQIRTVTFTGDSDTFALDPNIITNPNAKAFLYCGKHPEHKIGPKIGCKDYPIGEDYGVIGSESESSSSGFGYFLVIYNTDNHYYLSFRRN